MRRFVSSLLLLASAAVFISKAGVIVAMLAAKDAALWLGGWGILLISQPVLTVGILFLVLGLAMRWSAEAPQYPSHEPAKMKYRIAAYALIVLGAGIKTDHGIESATFAMTADASLGMFAYLPVLGPQLPLGLAAMLVGLLVLRRAPRAQAKVPVSPAPVFQDPLTPAKIRV